MKEDIKKVIEEMPPDMDSSGWPSLRLKKLTLNDFGRHDNVILDFSHNGSILGLACLIGPNGTGKTTILNAIQLLFSNYNGYTPERYRALMANYIRNPDGGPAMMLGNNFSVKGLFVSNGSEYEVEVTSKEVVSKHPDEIASRFSHYCYYANFDRELHMFTLKRKRWEQFRKFFSNMTGFPVNEETTVFDQKDNPEYFQLINEYVLGFNIEKPDEKISHRRCSAGERKIIKCFSTILNRAVQPPVILIDNVTDHVEISRHLPLMKHLEDCFPESQIISTCHSVPVQRNFPDRNKIVDMRVLSLPPFVALQPWRLRMNDEIWDTVEKIRSIRQMNEFEKTVKCMTGETLMETLMEDENLSAEDGASLCEDYIRSTLSQVCEGFCDYPPARINKA